MKGAPDYPYASPPGTRAWQPPHQPWDKYPAPILADSPDLPDEVPLFPPALAFIIAAVVGTLALGNITMGPVAHVLRPGPGFAVGLAYLISVLGSIGTQAAVLTILLVFAAWPIWLRLAWHWMLALAALSTWCIGFAIAEADWVFARSNFPQDELLVLLTGLPLVSLACQAPMWLFRLYFGWRIERPGDPWTGARRRLAISDFVVGTILVAVTMAIVRLGKPAGTEETDYFFGWSIGFAAAALISLACVMPIVYLTLGVRRAAWGAVGVAGMIAGAIAVSSTALMTLTRYTSGPSDREILLMMSSLAVSSAGLLAATLWIARASGYRLVINRYGEESRNSKP
jgi:hypothetical protein